jgi:hypothetical protein
VRDQGSTPAVVDPCVVLGRLAEQLAAGTDLASVLDDLAHDLGLRTAVLRTPGGGLMAVGGEALHAVPHMRAIPLTGPALELPVFGHDGVEVASLTVVGARPSLLPALRACAGVLGLALVPSGSLADLLEDAQADNDDVADRLHDGPVQSLVYARYTADAAVRGGDPAAARDAVQVALVELRRTLWSLRPRGASGLCSAVEQLVAHLAERGAAPLTLSAAADVAGPRAVLAYRLVQAVSGEEPVRVVLRSESNHVQVDIEGGAALPSAHRWARRARALSCDLTASAGRLRLVIPLNAPTGDDARTAS